MKLKKIISAVCAFAMIASIVTVANSASLGGNPTVTATFAGYEIDTEYDNQIVAKIDFELDSSAAEALAAYAESGKGANKVKTGNGITTAGISWTYDSDFEYWDDNVGDTVFTLNGNGNAVSFGPKTSTSEYLVDSVVKFSVRYAVYDNDLSGSIVITGASLDGKNTTDGGTVWSYHTNKGNITVTGCDIPSYNEWSTPAATPTPEVTPEPTPTVAPTPTPTPVVTPEPTPEVTPEPTTGKGVEKFADNDAAAWAWKTAAAAGSEVEVTVKANDETATKAFALKANVDATVKVGVIVQYNPTTFTSFEITDIVIK